MDWMDHACSKKTKAAQHRAILPKLHWLQHFFNSTSARWFQPEYYRLLLIHATRKANLASLQQSLDWQRHSQSQPTSPVMLILRCGFMRSLLYSKPLILPANDRNVLPIGKWKESQSCLAFYKNNKLGLAKKNADLAISNLPFTTPKNIMLLYDQKTNAKIKTVKLKSCSTVPAVQSFQSDCHNFLRFPLLLHEGAVTNQVEMQ